MKKSVIATVVAAAVAALCLPAFSGCSAQVGYILKTDKSGQKYYSVAAQGYTSYMDGEVVIPETYGEGDNCYPVKEIEAQAFYGTNITKVTIPASIEKIGTAAFAYSTSLSEVVFAEDIALEEIAWGSFGYCTNLKSITIPSSVKTIDGLAFYGCSVLETVDLSAGLQRINVEAFSECEALTSINFPQGLISIGRAAFYNCASLQSIVLPNGMCDTEVPSLDESGNEIMGEDGSPVTVTISALGEIAFFGCSNLKLAVLGEDITVITEGLFANCSALEKLYLPSTLKEVKGLYQTDTIAYGHAFYNTPNLKEVYFAGTEEQWAEVDINRSNYNNVSDNSSLINATVIFTTSFDF